MYQRFSTFYNLLEGNTCSSHYTLGIQSLLLFLLLGDDARLCGDVPVAGV